MVAGLTQVWNAIIGRPAPPITAALLLVGDHRAWPVAPDLQPLWTRLRLTTLWHLWRVSRRGAPAADAGAQPPTAARVASPVLHDCRGAMQHDFSRGSTERLTLETGLQHTLATRKQAGAFATGSRRAKDTPHTQDPCRQQAWQQALKTRLLHTLEAATRTQHPVLAGEGLRWLLQ